MELTWNQIRDLLNEKAYQYNNLDFIADDPVSVPHMFSDKADIEISGFLAATIAWGQRPVIIRNAKHLMQLMDYQPFDFVVNAQKDDLRQLDHFKHRTFNGQDCAYFVRALQHLYKYHGGLEDVFTALWQLHQADAGPAISAFREIFFEAGPPGRTKKHVADPFRGSSAKRINMFLRWMVRSDNRGVDFGLWKDIPASGLWCPLDLHTGNVARALGLITRKANDWKAVQELTAALRGFDPDDPVRYDFALFGMGIYL